MRSIVTALLLTCACICSTGAAASGAGSDNAASMQVAALDLKSSLVIPRPAKTEPFGYRLTGFEPRIFNARWRTVSREIEDDLKTAAQCRERPSACAPATRRFLAMADAAAEREGRARIGEINRAVNLAIRPMSDIAQHGTPDVWTSPLKTLSTGLGDCEDYAILKFAILRAAGIAEDDLRLVIVHELHAPADHAILSVRLNGRWLILDNRRLTMMDDTVSAARAIAVFRANEQPDPGKKPEALLVAAADLENAGSGGGSAVPLML
ncbi:MAG: transglutaminase-like cysteine peptidase [Pseudorhodoplanes sp.]